jgi:hypothetical protein
MKARQILGWVFAAIWLGGIQYYVYRYASMTVFWIVLIAWVSIGFITVRKFARRDDPK